MVRPGQWLKPPRTLLVYLFALTLVSISALSWFGWRLFDQERLVESQRAQERMEQMADRVAATLRGTLADTGDRLGVWLDAPDEPVPVENGVLLLMRDGHLSLSSHLRLLYSPLPSPLPEADGAVFAEAEMFEFQQGQPGEALLTYERLAGSGEAAIRAGALLRAARVLRSLGRDGEARAVYGKLAGMGNARTAGAPADLVARHALIASAEDAERLRGQLAAGKWQLTRGQFFFYWNDVQRRLQQTAAPPAEPLLLSQAVERVWEDRGRNGEPRGQETVWIGERPYFLLWRGTPERRAILLAPPVSILGPALASPDVRYAVVDNGGRLIAGKRAPTARAAVRTAAEHQLPWTLYIAPPSSMAALLSVQQRFVLLGLGVMVLFLVLGTYFIARAIRREADLVRMQSDFVSAVSHEFRSPLTTMRQLSEILALGRAPSEERRQLYYETMVKETSRLQRVVEALLHFGRMEAGARRYHFQELDAAALVRRVAAEFEQQSGAELSLEMEGCAEACTIDADPDAISVALRNLLDNAVKYSPDRPAVWVEWGHVQRFIAIKVKDRGLGVADHEKKAIFGKFVRGTAATASNAKGSGVGLAMVRHIVAAHGGEVRLESKPGQGSTFTILLPAVERT
ncbi:MAG: HAMP domain-containing histidine kinase [Bryobacterales bacterium]|nr:HAMP domain-containing histidine kinase [Bryobacterales bacterium]